MPKIEVDRADLLALAGLDGISDEELGLRLAILKGELDLRQGDTLRIELKDTNRPDLWCVEGVARGLAALDGRRRRRLSGMPEARRELYADASVGGIRPWIAAFAASGPPLTPSAVEALIAGQEKLASSFGRNRRTAAIGFYRLSDIEFPVRYSAVDPGTSFHPLGEASLMTLSEVLERTEVGRRYAALLAGCDAYPFLTDAVGRPLSFPPVVNSESTGRVREGDTDLFCEVTGTDWGTVGLTCVILACNLEDRGFDIEPVEIVFHGPAPGERARIATPVRRLDRLAIDREGIRRILGTVPPDDGIESALRRMDYDSWKVESGRVEAELPPYRRDGLHPVDLVEDIADAIGLESFEPLMPSAFTIGAAAPVEDLCDALRTAMIGMGFEEIMLPVLTSRSRPGLAPSGGPALIANPMTLEFGAVRNSLIPGLLAVEEQSGRAPYPHRLFETGEVLLVEPGGAAATRVLIAAAVFGNEAAFGDAHSVLAAICASRGLEARLEPGSDPRFIEGRCARVMVSGRHAGVVGELSPALLHEARVSRPGSAFELDAETLAG
ncbi:phenylalanine--tRNA ligase subunit beta [Candidatus Fermentibacteria bacterium]|nr:phenylalanine--tRNA ligase subunit beta [Candidatus Fermentibacteria bacterium]